MTRLRVWVRRALATLLLVLALLTIALFRTDLPPRVVEAEYADQDSQFAELAGQRVHFKDEGKGLPVLLLHGTASSLHTWDGWVRHLGDEFRLIRLDLPGYGLTGPPTGSGGTLVVLDALLDRLRVGPVVLAGNSLGGAIAWHYALERPGRVQGLILIAPAGYPGASQEAGSRQSGGGGRTLDLARVPVLGRLMTRLTPQWLIDRALHEVYADPAKIAPGVSQRYYRLLRRQGNRAALFAALNGQRGPSKYGRIGEIEQPVLIQWGSEDRWIPPEHGLRFEQDLPRAQAIFYQDVGHVPMEESPEATATDAAEFLRRLAAADGQRTR